MEITIIVIAIILVIVAFYLGRKFASKPIEDKNEEIKKEQEALLLQTQQILKDQEEKQKQLLSIVERTKDKLGELKRAEEKNQ